MSDTPQRPPRDSGPNGDSNRPSETSEAPPPPPPPVPGPTPPVPTPRATSELRPLVAQALVVALTPLIPVPFLDDWTRDRLRRWQVAQRAKRHARILDETAISTLALDPKAFRLSGCLKGCALTAVFKAGFYVLKKLSFKIFRKLVIFLMIKDCADQFARTLDEGVLLEHAFVGDLLRDPNPETVRRIRQAIESAYSEVGRGPIEQIARATFQGSRGLLRHAGREFSRRLRALRRSGGKSERIAPELEKEGEEELGSLIDTLTEALKDESAYFDRLVERFEAALAAPPPGSVPPGPMPPGSTPPGPMPPG